MFVPEINPITEHDTVKTLDALDTVCDHCENDTKCNRCVLNSIKDNISAILVEIVPLPEE